uniref:Zinc finger CCCH-type containing 11A n=1 Tax=Oryzias latipes TaxID=8090 RepID=A0A3P9LTS4_ORYLA
MTNHGDDCYFFYYSTCTKGDSCPFRHCEAAMGNETVCNLWQEGRCFRPTCKFRHMEITKNRKEIPCYWENQPAGCQKPHCAFFHEKPRCIQGLFVPPDQKHLEDTPAAPPVVLTTSTNPQLRGVIKTETTEPVPSPTHPPVVINAADDDEDEDGDVSEEGEDNRVGPSPRKLQRTGWVQLRQFTVQLGMLLLDQCCDLCAGEALTFGVSTLEEIRLRKALMASMRTGFGQRAEGVANGEKENIQAFFRATSSHVSCSRLSAGEAYLNNVPSSGSSAEKNSASVKDPVQIRIKTLEEIRREKAAKSQKDAPLDVSPDAPAEIPKTGTVRTNRGVKRTVSVKDAPVGNIKTFSEIVLSKKKRQEEKRARISKTAEGPVEKTVSRTPDESDTPEDGKEGKVRVKTLEEIRREKAARLQAQQDTDSGESRDQEGPARKRRLLRVKKLETQGKTVGSAEPSCRGKGPHPSSPADPPRVSVRKLLPPKSKGASNTQQVPIQGKTGDVTDSRSTTPPSENQNQTGSTEQSGESKGTELLCKPTPALASCLTCSTLIPVRPKLNVKPSVVKLATPLRPAQKKRGAEPSAVAAVKPLNSAAAVQEAPQESTCTPSQALLKSAVPRFPTPLPEASPGEEDTTRPTSDSSTPAVDDFEELINQFTDDHLDGDVDPGLGEDDLLQELSEMIDS